MLNELCGSRNGARKEGRKENGMDLECLLETEGWMVVCSLKKGV